MKLKHLDIGSVIKIKDTDLIYAYYGGYQFMDEYHQLTELSNPDLEFEDTDVEEYEEFRSGILKNSPAFIKCMCDMYATGTAVNVLIDIDYINSKILIKSGVDNQIINEFKL